MTSSFEPKARIIFTLAAVLFPIGCGSSPKPSPQFPQVPGLAQRQVQFQRIAYPFYVFVPSSSNGGEALPAILLIHGGGGKGPDLISAWKSFAEQNRIILVGPTVPLGGSFETAIAPQLYPLIMDAARKEWSIDPRRIYLFGVSAGGYTVFDGCMFDSQYFAGGGVFAAVITPDYDWILKKATRNYQSAFTSVTTTSSSALPRLRVRAICLLPTDSRSV